MKNKPSFEPFFWLCFPTWGKLDKIKKNRCLKQSIVDFSVTLFSLEQLE